MSAEVAGTPPVEAQDATNDHAMDVDAVSTGGTPDVSEQLQRVQPAQSKPSRSKALRGKSKGKKATATPDYVIASNVTREGSVASTSAGMTPATRDTTPLQQLKETDTSHVVLSSIFTSYVPRLGAESDDDDAATNKRGKKGKTKLREFGKPEEDEQDDRLYCVCRQLYDPDRIMICCDKCEDWYHLDCVGIREDRVELIDDFFCPLCTSRYSIETTYKRRCARPDCLHACSPLSKYCSDYCGIAVAAARISIDGFEAERLWKRVSAAHRHDARVFDVQHNREIDQERVDRTKRARISIKLDRVVRQQSALERSISLVDKRLEYLDKSIKRWEALCQATADQLVSEGIAAGNAPTNENGEGSGAGATKKSKKPSKVKKPVAATSLPEAQCGFDLRLVDEDQEWAEFVETRSVHDAVVGLDDLTGVCLEPRKRCDRHQGWQKVREADFEVEKAVLTRRLEGLATKERQLRQQLEDHDERVRFRLANSSRTGQAIEVKGHIVARSKPSSPAKRVQHKVDRQHSADKQKNTTTTVNGDDMIPDDVWAFLSRTEQAKLRAEGKHA